MKLSAAGDGPIVVKIAGVAGGVHLYREEMDGVANAGYRVAALDYGGHCYSTQFHPEGTDQTLGTVWRFSAPERMNNYHPHDKGRRLVENFLRLAIEVATARRSRLAPVEVGT